MADHFGEGVRLLMAEVTEQQAANQFAVKRMTDRGARGRSLFGVVGAKIAFYASGRLLPAVS